MERLLAGAAALAVVVALVVAIVTRDRPFDAMTHEAYTANLHELVAADAGLNQAVLAADSGLVAHYDRIVQLVAAITTLHAALRDPPAFLPEPARLELAERVTRYHAAHLAKVVRVEQFKSEAAILHNSFYLVPILAERVKLVRPHVALSVERLLRELLLFHLRPQPTTRTAAEQALQALASGLADSATAANDDLQQLARHSQAVLQRRPAVAELVRHIAEAPTARYAELVRQAYGVHYERVRARDDRISLLLATLLVVAIVAAAAAVILRLIRARTALRREQATTERLLLNVLPQPIADRLRHRDQVIADHFSDVSVLFADLVGFTQLATELTPGALVGLLNEIFSRFDRLADVLQVEKIKTLGDAYMVVAGVPTARVDHAEALAAMALGMQLALQEVDLARERGLQLRIGIHTGPVVAGVIGIRKFTYDLWGDTVNIASRMESHAQVGTIQVTAQTARLLRPRFRLQERGTIAIKGRGDMRTYLLLGRRADGASELDSDVHTL